MRPSSERPMGGTHHPEDVPMTEIDPLRFVLDVIFSRKARRR